MQSPLRSANGSDGPGTILSLVLAVVVGLAILLSQTVFIVPAGNVAVVTTLGKVTGVPRNPGANIKAHSYDRSNKINCSHNRGNARKCHGCEPHPLAANQIP